MTAAHNRSDNLSQKQPWIQVDQTEISNSNSSMPRDKKGKISRQLSGNS